MSSPAPVGAVVALVRAWRTVGTDPVRLLGLSAVPLLADLGTVAGAVALLRGDAPVWTLAALLGARCAVVGASHAVLLRCGAEAERLPTRTLLLGLLVGVAVELLGGAASLAAGVAATLPFLGLGLAVGLQGMLPGSLLAGAAALLAGWLGGAVVRAALAPLLPRAVLASGRGPVGGLAFGVGVTVIGDLLRVAGALALVAGALPAYPLPWLAWLARVPPLPVAPSSRSAV